MIVADTMDCPTCGQPVQLQYWKIHQNKHVSEEHCKTETLKKKKILTINFTKSSKARYVGTPRPSAV